MSNLECSTKGDKRFSALCAKIDGYSIEERYQLSKRFLYKKNILRPENYKQAKYWLFIVLPFLKQSVKVSNFFAYSIKFLCSVKYKYHKNL